MRNRSPVTSLNTPMTMTMAIMITAVTTTIMITATRR